MKIPAEFAPKSWEMPPGFRVLEESASVVTREFDGEKLDWLVALVEIPAGLYPMLWTRPLDERFDAGFIALDSNHYQALPFHSETDAVALRAALASSWKSNQLARQIFLNAQGELRCEGEKAHDAVTIAADGKAAWSLAAIERKVHDATLFEWSLPLTNTVFLRLPALEIWARLQKSLADSNGDALLAKRFTRMNEEERKELVFGSASINEDEFESLLICLIHLQKFWDEVSPDAEVRLFTEAGVDAELDLYDEENGIEEEVVLSADLIQGIDLLWECFEPTQTEMAKRDCVVKWLNGRDASWDVPIPYPTAHERIEASVRWREWKANHEKL